MKRRWKLLAALAVLVPLMAVAVLLVAVQTGLADRWIARQAISQIQKMTGGRVELGAAHFRLWGLRIELDNLTVHGRETPDRPPLFHAGQILVRARVLSFWGRTIALDEVLVTHPEIAVRVDQSGHSNVPSPAVKRQSRPWREQLFDLRIARLRLDDGSILYNDLRVPLTVDGKHFRFALHFDAPAPEKESYVGALDWQQMEIAAGRDLPFRSDLAMKFTLARDSLSLDDLQWKLPNSELYVRAELANFARSDWAIHYRGRLALADAGRILRNARMPKGAVDFSGAADYNEGGVQASGHYAAHAIALPYVWFHAQGIESAGRYEATRERLDLPQYEVRALGGTVRGKMRLVFRGLDFNVESHARGFNLAAVFDAVNNPSLPLDTFHWDGAMDVDAVNTWSGPFKHFRTRGETRWTPPATLPAGKLPVTARIDYDYSSDLRAVSLVNSEISTPASRIQMDGTLGAKDSALELTVDAEHLLEWDDFINQIRGVDAEPKTISGQVLWKGRLLGPLLTPTFAGHFHASEASYDQLYWDEISGDMEYSPDVLRLTHAEARRGAATAHLDLSMQLDGAWSFLPQSEWTLRTTFERTPSDGIQSLLDTSYPVQALLSGEIEAGGTRAEPHLDGRFTLDSMTVRGLQFDHASAQLSVRNDQVRLTQVELRKDSGRITGELLYQRADGEIDFTANGAALQLETIPSLQSSKLPVAGALNFEIHGRGPLRAPAIQGTVRLTGLRVGSESQGNFFARLDSDGRSGQLDLNSEPEKRLQGHLQIVLSGGYPITGRLSLTQFDLDPLIVAGLHLKDLTGHSSVDGNFAISGMLEHPETLVVQADMQRIVLNYELVSLENNGPVRLAYRRDEVRIEQANLRGANTDLHLSGAAHFSGSREMNLRADGNVDLRLADGLLAGLDAHGAAQINAALEGSFSRPRITGKIHVAGASAHYGDFPAGISKANGDFIFNRNRLTFDKVTAEAGGGTLTLSGALTYGDGPLRYEINSEATSVRIRYPAGLSWLGSANLKLSGSTQAAVLSGSIVADHLLFSEGVDLATLIVASHQGAPAASSASPFLRNLRFNMEVGTAPGARLEWAAARFELDGSLHVRGTWDHPVLLGDIHMLNGEMQFRGSKYQLSRGDINFSNPLRLDPVLNIEATTTVQQYEITLDFSGPASHISLAYRSDPPQPASDIVTLLALGSPGESSQSASTAGATGNYGATALLSEAISSQLGGRIEKLFGINRFSVDPFLAGTSTQQNAAARITVEKQVTHDLTVTYSTNATGNQEQVIQVEYAVRRDISIVALRDINGTFGLNVKFTKHFK